MPIRTQNPHTPYGIPVCLHELRTTESNSQNMSELNDVKHKIKTSLFNKEYLTGGIFHIKMLCSHDTFCKV